MVDKRSLNIKMTEEEVRALAAAIAATNGHSHPVEWAEKVVKSYKKYQAAPTQPDETSKRSRK